MKCENLHEKALYEQGYEYIVGIDEAGRGPICGPLVVAAVIFPKNYEHDEIYDSKKLSEKKRIQLFNQIIDDALAFYIQIVEPKEIDELNIYRATQVNMQKLVDKCAKVDAVLTDAMPLPNCQHKVEALVKGDQKSVSIAAASILAKVTRDRIMQVYDFMYPQYNLAKHKGYPTKAHLQAIEKYGIIDDLYRHSYNPVAKIDQRNKQVCFDFN